MTARCDINGTYDLLRDSAARHRERDALVFVPKGSADNGACTSIPTCCGESPRPPTCFTASASARRTSWRTCCRTCRHFFTLFGAEAAGIACAINPLLEPQHIVDILCEARAKVLVTVGPGPGGELWQKMAAVVGEVPTLETVLLVDLGQFLVPGYAAGNGVAPKHAGRTVLDFDHACEGVPATGW